MTTRIAEAVAEALSSGYQMHPDAFELLQSLKGEVDEVELVLKAVRKKQGLGDQRRIITKQDLEALLPPKPSLQEEASRREERVVPVRIEPEIEVLKDPSERISLSEDPRAFQRLFQNRFQKLLSVAKERPDSHLIRGIASAPEAEERPCKVAGLVLEKRIRRDRVEMVVDDETGRMTVTAMEEEVKKQAAEVSLDQLVILDVEATRRGRMVARAIYPPDIPEHVPNTSEKAVYAILTSDLHIGSRMFLKGAFQRLINWLVHGGEDSYLVKRVKYLIVAGDAVDGVGVYPGQEGDLVSHDTREQYAQLAELLKRIPDHIQIIVIPGNHDPVRQALPQPAIPERHAPLLYEMENVRMQGNPVLLRLHGVKLLIYHGRSLDDVVATTPGLTFSKPTAAMKVLLRARHLAPMYGGRTLIAPEPEDHLVIEEVPDVFHAGHVHTIDAERYRGTLIINSGTWQEQTKYQVNIGINPSPGILPIVNLSTLEVVTRDFSRDITGVTSQT